MKLIKAFKKTFKRSYKDANDIPVGDWEAMNKPDDILFGQNGLFTVAERDELLSGGTVEKANTFYRSAFSCEPARKQEYVLTAKAQADKDNFEHEYSGCGCTCYLGHAPCGYCTHPGNPICLEDDSCWEMRDVEMDNKVFTPPPSDCVVTTSGLSHLNPSQQILLEWYQDNRDKVPEWAKWIAIDRLGWAACFEDMPYAASVSWIWQGHTIWEFIHNFNRDFSDWSDAILELDKVK